MAKLNPEKWKKSSFYKEKSLVGLTPAGGVCICVLGVNPTKLFSS
jgi:hypothetical protein